MPRDIVRLILLMLLIFFVISDVLELLSYFPSASLTMAPLLKRMMATKLNTNQKLKLFKQENQPSSTFENNHLTENDHLRRHEVVKGADTFFGSKSSFSKLKQSIGRSDPVESRFRKMEFTDKETQTLLELKTQWLMIMQTHCLPKLVCELHASLTGQNMLTELEMGLLSAIRDTSLGNSGEIVSRYHFAAHMGQLLSGVEGNGCHNFYSKCPISRTQVLEMVKRVKVR